MSERGERTTNEGPVRSPLGRTVIVLSVVSFLNDVSSEMIYPLLPIFLGRVLGVGAATIGAIEGAAESVNAFLKFATGWWSDRLSRRKPLIAAGYALTSIARPFIAVAQNATQVLAVRLSDRVGKGIRNSPRDALIADSVDASIRGRAFGINRAADHAGAVLGPLIAFMLLRRPAEDLRAVFLWAAVPGVLVIPVILFGVHEARRPPRSETARQPAGEVDPDRTPLGAPFWRFLAIIFVFTLGNSTDAFLLLRAADLGVATVLVPLLWSMHHVVKSSSSVVGGSLSDRVGRRPLLIAGWLLYAAVYFAFGRATAAWHAWALFAVYGLFFGLTEGTEKALVADLVPAARRGTAFGAYNLAISAGALPASLIFGLLWQRVTPQAAFDFGAALALIAAVGGFAVLRGSSLAGAPSARSSGP